MQGVNSRCRSFRSAWALMSSLAGLAAFGMAGIGAVDRAIAQTSPSTSISGVFEPDNAEVTSAGLAALKDATEKAKAAAECYPPRVTFMARVKVTLGDPSYNESLAAVRGDQLKAALPSLGLDADQLRSGSAVVDMTGGDDVSVSNDPFNTDDKDPPRLKVTSKPPKGTKVKAGDKIEVTIIASERYKDGHKSWPTGVQMIQLLADDGLVDSKQYGRPPQPCARRTFVVTYTVPKTPPAIVHLHALAEDGVGHQSGEDAEFPTGDWTGTWQLSYRNRIDGGQFPWEFSHMDARLSAHFTFAVADNGSVEGSSKDAKVSFSYQDAGCGSVDTNHTCIGRCKGSGDIPETSVELKITGHRIGNSFQLKIESAQPDPSLTKTSVCVYPAGTSTHKSPPIYWFCSADRSRLCSGAGHFIEVEIPAKDGASKPIKYDKNGDSVNGLVKIWLTQ